ncbi:GNAT family N-acetyltransferase [Streptomyces sp. V1I1]|uniref:GNAT family N-acetyltransferase n=1 Tax=Streptomyces sp. V1I1 TaxID=3042272 RepID=UPI00278768CF|nr:GNAT family N-acetyltransferase [Streptomyces sp. V1I1]MDQ0940737.1 GNAT superfamily N-acetyltransferase [Streptomyces sp. V1I1]
MIDKAEVHTKLIDDQQMTAFLAFLDQTTLDSLAPVRTTRHPAPGQTYLCALYRDRVIGCTSWYESRRLNYVNLDGTTAHCTSVYLCSSEVLPEFRGMGIGSLLYERRLAECGKGTPTLNVEILGRGTPMSVNDLARPGLVWHLAHDFVIVGHSCDEDAGPVLTRPALRSHRALDTLPLSPPTYSSLAR